MTQSAGLDSQNSYTWRFFDFIDKPAFISWMENVKSAEEIQVSIIANWINKMWYVYSVLGNSYILQHTRIIK